MDRNRREGRPTVLVITPVYNEEASLPAYAAEVKRVLLDRTDASFRVLLLDDGSRDRSWEIIEGLSRADPRFQGIRLSRNFGSHAALRAGFAYAEADACATLACDLQDPPEAIVEFLGKWRAGADVVWGVRRTREDSPWRVGASGLFSWLLRRYAVPRDCEIVTGSFFLVDRQVARCVREYRERNPVMFALVAWTGFRQATVPYDRRRRTGGRSGWSFTGMVKAMYDAFLGFSSLPIQVMTATAVGTFLVSMLLALYLFVHWLRQETVPGWTSQMLAMLVLFAIQFSLIAIMGQYLFRIYAEVVGRPLYFVRDSTEGALPPPDGTPGDSPTRDGG